jgi:hypothetical protein
MLKKELTINTSGLTIPSATSITVTTDKKNNTAQILLWLDLNFTSPLKISNLCVLFPILKNYTR